MVPYDSIVEFMKKILLSLLSLTRDAFGYALIFYLVLFLLENLFPGFVSNNFSLNWVLGLVLFLGLLAACAPEKDEQPRELPTGKSDYLLVAGLSLIGGAIIFAKLETDLVLRWITTLVSGGLIMLVGFVVLTGRDDEKFGEIPAETQNTHIHKQKTFTFIKRVARLFLLRRVELPIAYVLLFAVITAFLIPKNISILANALRRPAPVPEAESQESTNSDEPFFWDDMNEFVPIPPSKNLPISVLNGGSERGAAASFSTQLIDNGFDRVTVGNADRYDYTNAQIRFAEADKPQANIIKRLLLTSYPLVLELPAESTAGGITVILGAKEKTL